MSPTSYTAPLYDGEAITFEQFAWRCARGMGALMHMRDDPLDAPIRDDDPSDYHDRALARARAELAAAGAWTDDEAERLSAAEHAKSIQRARESHEKTLALCARYDAMIERVEAWEPPTEDHVGLKDFMLSQLRDSRSFDATAFPEPGPQLTGADYRAAQIDRAASSVKYHKLEAAKERKRATARREWIAALQGALDGQPVAS